MGVSCALGGEEILADDQHRMYRQVVGWEPTRGRKKGGTNALRLRRETGAFACERHVEEAVRKQKAGLPFNQEGLF